MFIKMKIKNVFVYILFLFLGIQGVHSSNYETYKKAEYLLEIGNFKDALKIYQTLLQKNVNSANLNFKIGFCYLNIATQKAKSIPYFEFAAKNISEKYKVDNPKETKAPIEALFYLGQAYRVNYRFDDAKKTFNTLKKQLSRDKKKFIPLIEHEIDYCNVAKKLIKTPVEMTVSNLGKEINSKYTEHSPVLSGDEKTLIFTSKRKTTQENQSLENERYHEDIFISEFENGKFQKAKPISPNINTLGNEASIGLSFDGKKLLIYKDDKQNGNIYVSEKILNNWSVPVPIAANINSKYRETHASVSFDQNEIYFTSDRKGGYGGLDIYSVKKLPNGKWGKPQNLGPHINTPYDEEGPYLHPDGASLFFASKGHKSMGGFDIFVSHYDKKNKKWGKPQNIGYPINTPDDDVFYIPSVDGRRAYYASYANNSLGEYDIFRIDLSDSHIRNQTVITGVAKLKSGEKMQDPIVTISSMNDDLIGIYTPDENDKKFLAILPCGKNYKVLFEAANTDSFEKIISVPNLAYDQAPNTIMLDSIVLKTTEKEILPDKNKEAPKRLIIAKKNQAYKKTETSENPLASAVKFDEKKHFTTNKIKNKIEEKEEKKVDDELDSQQEKTINEKNIAEKEKSLKMKKNKSVNVFPFDKLIFWLIFVGAIASVWLLFRKRKK